MKPDSMNDVFSPVAFGVAGLGGFAGSVCDVLLEESQRRPEPFVRLHAVCEPRLGPEHADRVGRLKRHGVRVLERYDELLAQPIEAVWLPLPIHLHRPFAEQALRAGKAVMCEKPAAGCIDDVDAMIAAQQQANIPVAIGFQDIYAPHTLEIKRQLLAGQIGRPVSATLLVCWPRGDEYYSRNAWAGALRREGTWVLDSPLNNAAAHYLNLALFLLGDDERSAAVPQSVAAELYRARPIENYDTISMRLMLAGQVPLTVLMTHACRTTVQPHITIVGSQGIADIMWFDRAEFRRGDGEVTARVGLGDRRHHAPQAFARWLRSGGQAPPAEGAIATLHVSRPHALAVSGASEAAVVRDVPAEFIEAATSDSKRSVRAIRQIESILQRCAAEARLLSELPRPLVPWAAPPGMKDLRGYRHFAGPARTAERA